jgi:hypothetical protein
MKRAYVKPAIAISMAKLQSVTAAVLTSIPVVVGN